MIKAIRTIQSSYRKFVPIVDPITLTLILSNPTQPWVISNLTPCLAVITIKIYGLIFKFSNFTMYTSNTYRYSCHKLSECIRCALKVEHGYAIIYYLLTWGRCQTIAENIIMKIFSIRWMTSGDKTSLTAIVNEANYCNLVGSQSA